MDDSSAPAASTATTKPLRWKRALRWAAVAVVVALACTAFILRDYIHTLNSLRRIPGTNAYVMDYYVDYDIDEVRAHGIDVDRVEDSFLAVFFPDVLLPIATWLKSVYLAERIEAIPAGEHHCSTVVLQTNGGDVYFGRNFDYKHDTCLILKTHRPGFPETVSVLDLHYLNMDRDNLEDTSLLQRIPLLFAPYYLQDGMNQYGVAVADMSVDEVEPPRDSAKPNVIHSTAMRLILDYAKSADEAVEILRQFNVHFVAETCHLIIADASGKSKVVEFIDGEIKTTGTQENWQVCTNHQLCGKSEDQNYECCKRYRTASERLAKLSANADSDAVMNVMQSVQQDSTMWSSVYDLSSGELRFAYQKHYEQQYRDRIDVSN